MTAAVALEPEESTYTTMRRGLALSPELRTGIAGTLALAVVATAGKIVVPVAIQQGIDKGLRTAGGPDMGAIGTIVSLTAAMLVVTVTCGYFMNRRLFTVSERALSGLRIKTFRHIHNLSTLHQQTERRGSLVSRVTGDIDTISQFLQFGGLLLIISFGQLLVATIIMFAYSWQLTLVVWAAFGPLAFVIRHFQKRLAGAYSIARSKVGIMLGVVAESVVGASVIRAYGVHDRTADRLDTAVEEYREAQYQGLRTSVGIFSLGELAAGLVNAGVVLLGVALGLGGDLSVGELTAFLFLVALFVQPVQMATEILNDAQNAIAGWRRVLDVLDVQPDVADPVDGKALPAGPLGVSFKGVQFAYPGGAKVLSDVDVEIRAERKVAVVGETGSGKTTFAKLLTRLMDPAEGTVELGGEPLTGISFASLRSRVVMVPQDGFLFDTTVAGNVRFARPELTDAELLTAFEELGLGDWVAGLPEGLSTPVGERGEALSVGERQLVALARAYVADPDLLVLDEATSAVDPATEVRLARTLDAVTRGRTTIAIAHRLSTAQAADEVIVFDAGRIVQRGPHSALVAEEGSVYAKLFASWLEQTR
ncbi:ABC transporter ATP-binding protein [Longispora albida]|uniref:ABC transporter ATP-binding protein n=1 Tax=Longispora albida TaxID=203523 RepID=UPI00035F23F6|nr:ABC transporter ATP-binding protein [Longispora albida]